MKLHNFNSGPSILPAPVLEEAAASIHQFNKTGLSILEIGHRTAAFGEVIEEARASVKQLMQLSDEYEVLFFTWGSYYPVYAGAYEFAESCRYCCILY